MRRRANWTVEYLESRQLLAGNCSAALTKGVLSVSCDELSNQLAVVGSSAGGYSVVGANGTLINGGSSFAAPRPMRNLWVDLAQGGSDSLTIGGPLAVAGRLSIKMGAGALVITGSDGQVRVSGDVDIRRDTPAAGLDVVVRDQVRFGRHVFLEGCRFATIESTNGHSGPLFAGPVSIRPCEDVMIRSSGTSGGPRFRGPVTITGGFDARIESNDSSVGPAFAGPVTMTVGESLRIGSHGASVGAAFGGSLDVWAAVNIVVQSYDSSEGARFDGSVRFRAGDDVYLQSNDTSRGPVLNGVATLLADVSVIVQSRDDSIGPVLRNQVTMDTGLDVFIDTRDNSRGPEFRGPVHMRAGTEVFLWSWGSSQGAAFYDSVEIDAGSSVYVQAFDNSTGAIVKPAAGGSGRLERIMRRVRASSPSIFTVRVHGPGDLIIDGASFSSLVDIQMSEHDNRVRLVDSIFERGVRADGGLGSDTLEDGGGNLFAGPVAFIGFETFIS